MDDMLNYAYSRNDRIEKIEKNELENRKDAQITSKEKVSRDQLEKLFLLGFFSPPELGSLALRINISHLTSIFAASHSLTKTANHA
jgi:hypothetical protein